MPIYYKVYNCYPSFIGSFTGQAGGSVVNPVPNYGSVGSHLEDYFDNHMAETPSGGTDNLVAFLACQKSLTGIVASDLTGMANNLSVNFGITGSSSGKGLLDFRGPSWKYLMGDGIVGPSNTSNTTAYTNTVAAAVTILNHFNKQYPYIAWAFAGLPHLPRYTTFAPTAGSAFSWAPSLGNTAGGVNNHWDAAHPTGPTGYGERFFDWEHTPTELRDFHTAKAISRCQSILDVSGWLCPDLNPTLSQDSLFGLYNETIDGQYAYAQDLTQISTDYSMEQLRSCEVVPLVCSMVSSRESHQFDAATGNFRTTSFAYGVSGEVVTVYSGFRSATADASDYETTLPFLKTGMLEAGVRGGAVGFVYQDNIPLMVELACTGATPSTSDATQAMQRARKYIANKVYGGAGVASIPWSSVKNEVKSYLSYNVTANQLRTFSETLPIGEAWGTAFAAGDVANGGGPSEGVPQYDSVGWDTSSPTDTANGSGSGVVECPCPEPPTGACCNNGNCTEGVKEADCQGAWTQGASCSSLSGDTNCNDPLVSCCTETGCQQVRRSLCTDSTSCGNGTCCNDPSSRLNCICTDTCKERNVYGVDENGNELTCDRTFISMSVKSGSCCCQSSGGQYSNPPADCPDLNCDCVPTPDDDCCPGPCDDIISVSLGLQGCCQLTCESNRNGPCPAFPCRGDVQPFTTNCQNGTFFNLLSSSDISTSTKQKLILTASQLVGVTLTQAQIAAYTQNTQFRAARTVSNTLAYYSSQTGIGRDVAYANFNANYASTASVAQRISSEFGFDRFFIPIAYT